MKDILGWLKTVEDRAMILYDKAAGSFPEDRELTGLFTRLATDEEAHFNMIVKAETHFKRSPELTPIVVLDDRVRKRIDRRLERCMEIISSDKPSKKLLMDLIIRIEHSEANDLFLYTFNSLKSDRKEFDAVEKMLTEHKGMIEDFLASKPEYSSHLKAVKSLPGLWEENVLIVEDGDEIRDILENILINEDSIEIAKTTEEALEKLAEKNFSAVIAETSGKGIDGVALYKEASKKYPAFKEKTLFFASPGETETIEFLEASGLRHLRKPSSIDEIKKAVMEMLYMETP